MNLADMLSYADIFELTRIARKYNCECSGNSKNQLIQSILTTVGRRDVLEKQVMELTVEETRLLNSLVSDRRDSFSLEELVARVKQTRFPVQGAPLEDCNPREAIGEFKQRGWLFNGYSQQTKYLFHIPVDLKKRFSDTLNKRFLQQIEVVPHEPSIYREEQGLIEDDIIHFLAFVQKQNIQLSTEGFMYKRILQLAMESLTITEQLVTKTAWRFGYGRRFKEYPNRFSFIYDYCFFYDYIVEDNDLLTITELGKARLLSGKKEDLVQIYRFWLRLYKGAIPNLQSIVQWIERLSTSWVTRESLMEEMCKLIKPFYYDAPESIFEQRILQIMLHLGLLRIGNHDQFGKVLQINKLGSSVIKGTYSKEMERIKLI